MIEIHPFGDFIPKNIKYLLVGSFTSKGQKDNPLYDWFYVNGRNQFWSIIEAVYNLKLENTKSKKELFEKLGIGITDVIYQCERRDGNSLDNNLINISYNLESINRIFKNHKLEKVFFSSKYVEKQFKKVFRDIIKEFPDIELITLPSPSPRYAVMSKAEKINIYKSYLPILKN